MVEKKTKEEREIDRKQRKEELNFFKRTNQQLKSQIEAIMTPGKQKTFQFKSQKFINCPHYLNGLMMATWRCHVKTNKQ